MAEMISPAGNMEVKMLGFGRDGSKLVLVSQMGVWDTKIYFAPREVFHLIKLMLNLAVVGYIIALPFLYLSSITCRKQKK